MDTPAYRIEDQNTIFCIAWKITTSVAMYFYGLQKNAKYHGNLTNRTSDLHEGAINSKQRSHCHFLLRIM